MTEIHYDYRLHIFSFKYDSKHGKNLLLFLKTLKIIGRKFKKGSEGKLKLNGLYKDHLPALPKSHPASVGVRYSAMISILLGADRRHFVAEQSFAQDGS